LESDASTLEMLALLAKRFAFLAFALLDRPPHSD
jgi:hypothetical protein